ncbi:hypothetical protein [Spiroplasma endosymbiont of Andrena trimmerana]|uniref:hypothetical protein n=1 Tax=Spiroplasma endosymbiont of Andrena trimmerana TaxID=3066316 RepID=UPI0030D5BB8A
MEQQESKTQTSSNELKSKIEIGQEKLQNELETVSVSKETKKGIAEQIEAINQLEKMINEVKKQLNKNAY